MRFRRGRRRFVARGRRGRRGRRFGSARFGRRLRIGYRM